MKNQTSSAPAAGYEKGAEHHVFNKESFRPVLDDETLLMSSGLMRCIGGYGFGGFISVKGPLKSSVGIDLKGESGEDALALMWQINKACREEERNYNLDGTRERMGFSMLNVTPLPARYALDAMVASGADKWIPPYFRKVEFLMFDEPGCGPRVYIGVTGMNFRSEGPGVDAPVDDSWGGAVFVAVDFALCPKTLQEALLENERASA